MRKVILTYGLIAGAILAAMMLIALPFQARIGFERAAVVGYTSMVLAFLMVYFGIRSYRDTVGGGQVPFPRALLVGLAIVGIATVCYVATWEVIYYGFTPDFAEKYGAHLVEQARQAGATEAEVAAKVREMEEFARMYANPLVNIAMTALEPLPVGLVFALVSAGILSRKKRDPDTESELASA
ncbi:MAG: DUF4199 domain-containing protein [Gemmatimonadales bacterium]